MRIESHREEDVRIVFELAPHTDNKTKRLVFRGSWDMKSGWSFRLQGSLDPNTMSISGRKVYDVPIEESHLTAKRLRREAIVACMQSSVIRRPWSVGSISRAQDARYGVLGMQYAHKWTIFDCNLRHLQQLLPLGMRAPDV